jgi:hypothetical protein
MTRVNVVSKRLKRLKIAKKDKERPSAACQKDEESDDETDDNSRGMS